MNKHFVKCWDENKGVLEEWFSQEKMGFSYDEIVKKLFELVLTPDASYPDEFNLETLRCIDDGHYQGTQLFIIAHDGYQPEEDDYVITSVSYGSCSGCDTLESIFSYGYGELPNEEQVKDLMMLALHLVQRAKYIFRKDEV